MLVRRIITTITLTFSSLGFLLGCGGETAHGPVAGEISQALPQAMNIQLLGHHDLQGRASYQPTLHQFGERTILFAGHHSGEALNPLTGNIEKNGYSALDVTDPAHPVLLHHEPPTGLMKWVLSFRKPLKQ